MKKSLFWGLPLLFAMASVCAGDEAPAQLVLKQDFERSDSVADWRQWLPAGAPANSLTRDSAPQQSHAGEAALRYEIRNESSDARYIISGAKLPEGADVAGRTLRVRLFARSSALAPEQQVRFRVLERNANGVNGWLGGKENLLPLKTSTEWQEFNTTAKLATTTRGLTLYFVFPKPLPGQTLWIDDLSVEVVPPTAP